jgi:seryl-tRNA synthetase
MKFFPKIALIGLLNISLFAQDTNQTKTALEMFLFKIGINSIANNLETQQKDINLNKQEIEKLKSDIKYLLKQNIKNKLTIKDDIPVVQEDNNDKIKQLQEENQKLKKYINQLKTKTTQKIIIKKEAPKYKITKVVDEKASLKKLPFPNSIISRYVYKNDILKISFCNKYGWCKIFNKGEYIPKYKLYFIKDK